MRRGMLSVVPARLVLVRHGQSEWNASGLLQGQADPALSATGRAEAAALAPLLRGVRATRVVASDLRRARETAALAGHPGAELDPRWREIDVGEWQGRPVAGLPQGMEPAWRGGDLVAPGGEAWPQLVERVGAALDELAREDGDVLVFAHGGAVKAAVQRVTGAPGVRLGGLPNASVTVLRAAPPQLVAYGVTAGLDLAA
jgi:probable phosphoglycerate mutase